MSDESTIERGDPNQQGDLRVALAAVERRLRRLTVAVMLMTLVLILTVAAVFGELVNYFGGDAMLFGGTSIGAALMGFGFGWMARRRA